ncbi:MAG: hypothetical protein K2N04_03190 [Alistipes sp.]|nr:hypothetical protein [Alistipes sp.]
MIKKLLGMLFAAATLATIVLTILGRGNYRSMIWDDEPGVHHIIRAVMPNISAGKGPTAEAAPATSAGTTARTNPTDASNRPAPSATGTSRPATSAASPSASARKSQNAASDDDLLSRRPKKNANGEYEDYLDMPDSLVCPDPLEEINN